MRCPELRYSREGWSCRRRLPRKWRYAEAAACERDRNCLRRVLEDVDADHRAVVADGVVSAMSAIWSDMWGPRLEQILRHSAAAFIETPNASLVLLPRLLTDAGFRARIASKLSNPLTRSFFQQQFDSGAMAFGKKRSLRFSARSTHSCSPLLSAISLARAEARCISSGPWLVAVL